MHFKCLTVEKWSTSLDATKNHHCPNESGCSCLCMEISAERARKRFTSLRRKDTHKYIRKEIAISGAPKFTSSSSKSPPELLA